MRREGGKVWEGLHRRCRRRRMHTAAALTVAVAVAMMVLATVAGAALWAGEEMALDEGDMEALRAIRGGLWDLPGSTFFETWDMEGAAEGRVYACSSFAGLVCDYDDEDGGGDGWRLRVRELNLGANLADSPGLGGALHEELGRLTALRQLTVSPGEVGGEIPHSIGRLTKLEFLGISRNRISGAIPPTLAQGLISLRTLDLSYNNLIGPIPPPLLRLPNLQALVLGHNRLVGPPFSAGGAAPFSPLLTHVDLQSNHLSGSLPDSNPLPPSVAFLSIASNFLSGPLPASFFFPATQLYFLDLSFNNLSGSIPADPLLSLPLHSLLLHHNHFSGTLSPSSLVPIATLDLSFNELSGPLSPFLSTVSNLYLGNNRFTGEVPQEFVDELLAGDLVNLFLPYNFVTGFGIQPGDLLPPTSSLCIDFNCMERTPSQSHCPLQQEEQQVQEGSSVYYQACTAGGRP